MCGIILLSVTGCNKMGANEEKLQEVNGQIIDYFKTYGVKNYENYAFNYVDEENNVVVVGLFDNSKAEQDKFKETVADSELIRFVKGQNLTNERESTNLKSFIRTYRILNVADSNDYNYIYLTIRQFQDEEVQTIKVKRELCPDITVGKNYEFTIKPNYKLKDNILSIFNNSEILEIKETNKLGLEQIQESIS